ncbi:MAG: hypothetical protein LBP35_03380 [Candidatus Ancillula trichonymphae]|jgi:hypothetical protein|nr:hypothetical protein [Candidatus Ancillula trichonymphae]
MVIICKFCDPKRINSPHNVKDIAVGGTSVETAYALALTANGVVYTWGPGSKTAGGTRTYAPTPFEKLVESFRGVENIFATHNRVYTQRGSIVYAWNMPADNAEAVCEAVSKQNCDFLQTHSLGSPSTRKAPPPTRAFVQVLIIISTHSILRT